MSGESGTLRIQLLGPVRAWRGGAGTAHRVATAARRARHAGDARRPAGGGERDRPRPGRGAAGPARGQPGGRARHRAAPGARGCVPAGGAAGQRSPAVLDGPALAGGPGYLLWLDAAGMDARLLDGDLASARGWCAAGRLHSAARALDAAVARFHGQPLHAVPGPWAAAERDRLAELRLAVLEERVEVMLALGRHHEAVPAADRRSSGSIRSASGSWASSWWRCTGRAGGPRRWPSSPRPARYRPGSPPGRPARACSGCSCRSSPGTPPS